jgi:hypothetical protein
MAQKMRDRSRPSKDDGDASSKGISPPSARTTLCKFNDFFCQVANNIDALSRTEPAAARARWGALKESAETDDSGGWPPDLFDAGAIATNINHPVVALVNLNIVLSIKQSYDYAQAREELKFALPPTLSAYERTFMKRFRAALGRDPYNFGSDRRKRHAVTYAELLHMYGVPGLVLVEELDRALRARLEAL